MAKLYFKYGAMGSSKSAQALITQFNYEELGMSVWLIKPSTDTRDGADIIRSRTYSPFMPLIAIALIYLALVMFFTKLVGILERRLRNSDH